jgi:hypothetical protein
MPPADGVEPQADGLFPRRVLSRRRDLRNCRRNIVKRILVPA